MMTWLIAIRASVPIESTWGFVVFGALVGGMIGGVVGFGTALACSALR